MAAAVDDHVTIQIMHREFPEINETRNLFRLESVQIGSKQRQNHSLIHLKSTWNTFVCGRVVQTVHIRLPVLGEVKCEVVMVVMGVVMVTAHVVVNMHGGS